MLVESVAVGGRLTWLRQDTGLLSRSFQLLGLSGEALLPNVSLKREDLQVWLLWHKWGFTLVLPLLSLGLFLEDCFVLPSIKKKKRCLL